MRNALTLQKILNQECYRTLAAGGYVRDFLMRLPSKDIDLATEATPEEVMQILKDNGIKTIATGLQHGTITAIIENKAYEITTLRVDKQCLGREAVVEFVKSFEEDAKRRDLTINALFMDLETLEIFDYVDGVKDISENILRFVGNPRQRIQEDYLRILRYYRFAARYGYVLDEDSIAACREYLPFLDTISKERIRDEFLKIITETYVLDILECHRDIIFYIFPELLPTYNFQHKDIPEPLDIYLYTGLGISYLSQYKDPILSLAFLFHNVAKPQGMNLDYSNIGSQIVREVGYRLKLSTQQIKEVTFLVQNHTRLEMCVTTLQLRQLIKDCFLFGDVSIIDKLYTHYLAELFAKGIDKRILEKSDILEAIKYVSQFFKKDIPTCSISGEDILQRYNLKPGPVVGKLKERVIQKLINGELENTPEAIWCYLDKESKF